MTYQNQLKPGQEPQDTLDEIHPSIIAVAQALAYTGPPRPTDGHTFDASMDSSGVAAIVIDDVLVARCWPNSDESWSVHWWNPDHTLQGSDRIAPTDIEQPLAVIYRMLCDRFPRGIERIPPAPNYPGDTGGEG